MDGTISGKIAKEVFAEVITEGRLASDIVKERGLTQISDRSAIESAVKQVINEHPEVVSKFKAGQVTVAGFLVGKVIKAM
ncbi:Asp-tRNA(Asn)/Glu-tRNA(Gln) amidotransferase GatCAB subunit B, partial [Acinetobacter baumannii]